MGQISESQMRILNLIEMIIDEMFQEKVPEEAIDLLQESKRICKESFMKSAL